MSGVILGIMGNARAGKDTVATYLVRNHGFTRIGFADPLKRYTKNLFDFSDKQIWGSMKEDPDWRYPRSLPARTDPENTKRWLLSLFEAAETPEEIAAWKRTAGAHFLTPRYAMQRGGTEWGRDCYDTIWATKGVRIASELVRDESLMYDSTHGLQPKRQPGPFPTNHVVFSDCRFRNEFDAIRDVGGKMARIRRPGYVGAVGMTDHPSELEQQSIPDPEFDFVLNNDGTLAQLHTLVDHALIPLLGGVKPTP